MGWDLEDAKLDYLMNAPFECYPTERQLNCFNGHRMCWCAGTSECHDCSMNLPEDYTAARYPELNEEKI